MPTPHDRNMAKGGGRHVGGKRVPSTSTGWDDVAAANATFATLTKTHTLPSHVWKSESQNAQAEDGEEQRKMMFHTCKLLQRVTLGVQLYSGRRDLRLG